ncbi:VIT1/CCC1 transporter family protein [Cellulomonas sp. NPDC089187]|uniref:VIT1/CCC1 transporter family protein n=1 Tax=Cellulomonas sp. NPDC089187 TaxID=3154970 RepID=UPI003427F282
MSTLSEHLIGRPATTPAGQDTLPASAAGSVPPAPVPSAERLNWLRAGVLGANDGIVSVAATVVGVAGAAVDNRALVVAGIAALVAGALSMAAGEYVSVSSQRDAELTMRAHGVLAEDAELTNPWHAALASLLSFVVGGVIPLLMVLLPLGTARIPAAFGAVVLALVLTGAISAKLGGARVPRAVARNVLGGSLAMAVTYGIGSLVGLAV